MNEDESIDQPTERPEADTTVSRIVLRMLPEFKQIGEHIKEASALFASLRDSPPA